MLCMMCNLVCLCGPYLYDVVIVYVCVFVLLSVCGYWVVIIIQMYVLPMYECVMVIMCVLCMCCANVSDVWFMYISDKLLYVCIVYVLVLVFVCMYCVRVGLWWLVLRSWYVCVMSISSSVVCGVCMFMCMCMYVLCV